MIRKPSTDGNNLLLFYIAHLNLRDSAKLVEEGEADPNCFNANGSTPLHFSVYYGCLEIAELLLKKGADPNRQELQEIGGCSPLQRAVEKNNYKMVALLLQNGANPQIKSKNGFTALHYAAREGFKEIVVLLVASGADVNARDASGFTAAFWANLNKHTAVLELLPPPQSWTIDQLYTHRLDIRRGHVLNNNKRKGMMKK